MSTTATDLSAAVTSPGGYVTIPGVGPDGRPASRSLFAVRKLSVGHERLLRSGLVALARDASGPAGFFSRMAPALRWLREAKLYDEWAEAVKQTTALQGGGAEPDAAAVEEARQSRAGVVLELYHRTRQQHPDVTRDEIAAVVTDETAHEVYEQIMVAITDHKS